MSDFLIIDSVICVIFDSPDPDLGNGEVISSLDMGLDFYIGSG